MTGRPRGRPRKNPEASPAVKTPKSVNSTPLSLRKLEAEDSLIRSSPRKRKPANFEGFVVESAAGDVIGEGADIIKEIDDEESDGIKEEIDDDEGYDRAYKPGIPAPLSAYKKKQAAARLAAKRKPRTSLEEELETAEKEMVQMEDIEEEVDDDPMRRVERRGRKKKRVLEEGETPAPAPPVKRKPGRPSLKSAAAAAAATPTAVTAADPPATPAAAAAEGEEGVSREGEEEAVAAEAISVDPPVLVPSSTPRKTPRGGVETPSKNGGSTPRSGAGPNRRKQPLRVEDEEEYHEEIVEEEVDLMDEDLVDVESFEIPHAGREKGSLMLARMVNKPFRCAECGASYRREAYLLNHLATVHKDECAILSAQERSAKRSERRPERDSTRERPGEAAFKFGCDLCSRRFLRYEGLVVHQKQIHKGVTEAAKEQEKNRDYGAKCPVCLLYFFGNHALSEHVSKTHPNHNRFIFACDICGMGFMHWARVRAHKTQIHNVPVKYSQGYLKNNPEMARVVEAQRMAKAVERNRAKRLLEKGMMPERRERGEIVGLTRSEVNEYMYLMPPHLEPQERGEVYEEEYDEEEEEEEEEEIVEEEGIIDATEMMNIQMVPVPSSSQIRRHQLPPRMMGYREYYRWNNTPSRNQHQLARLQQRVTELDRRDLEILNRRMPEGVMKEEVVEEEVVVDDMMEGVETLEEEVVLEETEEVLTEEVIGEEEEGVVEKVEVEEEEEVEEEGEGELPPELDLYE